jgi:hypothetical protein
MSKVCTVSLELLRKGPPHNQLLSPHTDYLALCGNNGAAVVQVPYEHQEFLRKLKELRYEGAGAQDPARRLGEINRTADDIAKLFASVPGLAAELCNAPADQGKLIHLSLVLSAAELSLLPYELSKVPEGSPGGAGNWFLLQTLAPICLTRRVRSVSNRSIVWPRKPRILFIAAQPRGLKVPVLQHTRVLLAAIKPWMRPVADNSPEDLENKVGEIMTILPDATIEAVTEACQQERYTHVHILAHGKEDGNQEGKPYGLAFHKQNRPDDIDVVSGARLATALRPLSENEAAKENCTSPVLVTVASCDSGHVGDITYNNGASFAHDLHQAGVPLVVASQFPLSFEGSVHMAKVLYEKILWGGDPRAALHQLRRKLHALHGYDRHDWASLVAYACLPDNIDRQLEEVRYKQARAAIDIAMKEIDQSIEAMDQMPMNSAESQSNQTDSVPIMLRPCFDRVDAAAERLPREGIFTTEGLGLLGSTEKRKAQAWYRAALCAKDQPKQKDFRDNGLKALRGAYRYYELAYQHKISQSEGSPGHGYQLHWVLCQYVSLRAVLGEDFVRDHWYAAHLAAEVDLNASNASIRSWAHGTLTELYLCLHGHEESDVPILHKMAEEQALHHAKSILKISGPDSFEVYSTRRQIQRYSDWWCEREFEAHLQSASSKRRRIWSAEGGIKQLAAELTKLLPESFIWK